MGKNSKSQETRFQIIGLSKDARNSQRKIAVLLNVSRKCVQTTLKNYSINNNVSDLPRSGRLLCSTERDDKMLCRKALENCLIPSIELFYGKEEYYQFQQDNAPCHTANIMCSQKPEQPGWFMENDIPLLDWASRSPDLNPIENIWSWMDRRLLDKQISSVEHLKTELFSLWNDIPAQICENLINSMPKRVRECKNNKGGHFSY